MRSSDQHQTGRRAELQHAAVGGGGSPEGHRHCEREEEQTVGRGHEARALLLALS